MKKNRRSGEEDKVLRFAVIAVVVLFLIGAAVIAVRMMNLRVDVSEGEKKLKELGKADVQEVEGKIQELEKAERLADEEWQNRPNNEKFAGSLVMGDSITQGLYVYEILDSSLVVAKKGVGVRSPDKTGLSDMINQVISAKPQNLFLAFGMNDIVAAGGDANVFSADYKVVLERLKEGLPDTKIYVNSVLPARQNVVAKDARYGKVPEYNESLKALCAEEEVTFIDNTGLVTEEYYEVDGIHMKKVYYQGWVNQMAVEADL